MKVVCYIIQIILKGFFFCNLARFITLKHFRSVAWPRYYHATSSAVFWLFYVTVGQCYVVELYRVSENGKTINEHPQQLIIKFPEIYSHTEILLLEVYL